MQLLRRDFSPPKVSSMGDIFQLAVLELVRKAAVHTRCVRCVVIESSSVSCAGTFWQRFAARHQSTRAASFGLRLGRDESA